MAEPEPCLVVAEIGSGHGLSTQRAEDLIRAAIDAGADLIKFQHFYAAEIIHPRTGYVRLPAGKVRLYDRFKELEMSPRFLEFLKGACEKRGGKFFCSPFGLQSAQDLLALGERSFKIASPELNHIPLLEFLAERAESLVLSTGVSYLADIEEALDSVQNQHGEAPPTLSLLHCITAYPAPAAEYNLNIIPNLSSIFGLPVGISDHSAEPSLVPALAVLCGARMVEKHFTLSRDGTGLDDSFSLSPKDFEAMVMAVRESEALVKMLKQDQTRARPSIFSVSITEMCTGHSVLKEVDASIITRILGTGVKKPAKSELENYGRTNRSIHLLEDRQAGHVLRSSDIAILRSEKNLRPGLHPRYVTQILNCRLSRRVKGGDGIVWQDLLNP